jgi:pantoate--beta-alanine ligase
VSTSTPRLVTTRSELVDALSTRRTAGQRVGLVPTMGALHEGHASLMARARAEVGAGPVVVSVFVNPLQFGPGEDLDRYPRTLDADLDTCGAQGVDVVFAPSVDEVYPGGLPQVTVDPGPLGGVLEGRTRPGHFAGVLTVVAKLLGLVRPDVAVFGQKDYQQLVLISRMASDLCLGVDVVGAETVREPDGLALSSRNRFLDAEQRLEAAGLQRTLAAARAAAPHGLAAAEAAARAELRQTRDVDLDYLAFTLPDLAALPVEIEAGTHARALVAARVGSTRLIDNVPIVLGTLATQTRTP